MAKQTVSLARPGNGLGHWLLKHRIEQPRQGPGAREDEAQQHPWWQVVCLTGVDYFSALGYIPGIALSAAGVLSPIATMLIVLLTLFGALPMYRVVAGRSIRFTLFGEGDTAPVTHEVLRGAEPAQRPVIHVGGR